jgi:hypothetical protein
MESASLVTLGVDIIKAAERNGACIRLLGGVAVNLLCADSLDAEPSLRRTPKDIDLAGYSRQSTSIERTLTYCDFEGAKEFNFLNSGRRLIFYRRDGGVKIDMFLDEFHMCHRLSFKGRLGSLPLTLSLTDLLLTKLQVVELTEQDLTDIYAMLLQATMDASSSVSLDLCQIGAICATDWGWYKTLSGNVTLLAHMSGRYLKGPSQERAVAALQMLTIAIEGRRKSLRWRVRAVIGEHKRWYDRPESPG